RGSHPLLARAQSPCPVRGWGRPRPVLGARAETEREGRRWPVEPTQRGSPPRRQPRRTNGRAEISKTEAGGKSWDSPFRVWSAVQLVGNAAGAQTGRRGGTRERAQRAETLPKRGRTWATASAASASTACGCASGGAQAWR